MLEEERSSFESGVSRRLQGQQGLRRPKSFKRGRRVSEHWRGSEEAKGTERSRSIPLGRGSRGGSESSSNGKSNGFGASQPLPGLAGAAPRLPSSGMARSDRAGSTWCV